MNIDTKIQTQMSPGMSNDEHENNNNHLGTPSHEHEHEHGYNPMNSNATFHSPGTSTGNDSDIHLNTGSRTGHRTGSQDQDSTNSTNEKEEKEENKKEKEALISILNIVVDHVMVDPTPLEPEEYKWKLLQLSKLKMQMQRQNKDKDKDNDNSGINLQEENENATISNRKEQSETDCNFGSNFNVFTQVDDEHIMDNNHDDDDEEVQVPVIRIFGPIVKGEGRTITSNSMNHSEKDTNTPLPSPSSSPSSSPSIRYQSGCLHIHGAYPYMLARPVTAGPDGSSFFYIDSNKTGDNNIVDWDDDESVATILEDIHVQLESALRSSMEHNHNNNNSGLGTGAAPVGGGDDNDDNPFMSKTKIIRFIRQVTIVRGRGFYTFCNGTIAPFLRIEYYDPGHRWRVKIMLERGFEMPSNYHPYYGAPPLDENSTSTTIDNDIDTGIDIDTGTDNHEMDVKVLKFRCYEAHIPYTMQFFKDWNLAGMAWIKIGDGRFRNPLPRTMKIRCKMKDTSNKQRLLSTEIDESLIITSKNITSGLLWKEKSIMNKKEQVDRSHASLDAHQMIMDDEFWTRKETSCDVELDTTVGHILNVKDVMTSVTSSDPEYERGIHWRAVPSLREIWAEERQRMANLLPPKDNFLSNNDDDDDDDDDDDEEDGSNKKIKGQSFTLSVKKGAPIPGSRLACKGNTQLFDSSPQMRNDFQRAMRDIVRRHESNLEKVQSNANEKYTKRKSGNKKSSHVAGNSTENISLLLSQKDEALLALESLIGQFSAECSPDEDYDIDSHSQTMDKAKKIETSPKNKQNSCFSPSFDDNFLSQLSQRKPYENSLSQFSQRKPFDNYLSQYSQRKQLLTQADLKEVREDLKFCMGVDRGNTLWQGSNNISESIEGNIDPTSLTPYEDLNNDNVLDEEEDMGEEEFEKSLTVLSTQMLTPSKVATNQLTSIDQLRLESQAGSSSNCIESTDLNYYNDSNKHKEETASLNKEKTFVTKSDIHKNSTTLGQQSISSGDQLSSLSPNEEIIHPQSSSEYINNLNTTTGKTSVTKSGIHENNTALGQQSISSGDQLPSLSPNEQINHTQPPSECVNNLNILSLLSPNSVSKHDGCSLELKRRPPLRYHLDSKNIFSKTRLHPIIHNTLSSVPWLGYVPYLGEVMPIKNQSKEPERGIFLQPVSGPPSASRIRKWVEKRRTKSKVLLTNSTLDKKRTSDDTNAIKSENKALEHDSNTRKLICVDDRKRKRKVAFADDIHIANSMVREIEEVSWKDPSQELTQDSSNGNAPQLGLSSPLESDCNGQYDGSNCSSITQISTTLTHSTSPRKADPLEGIGQQGGKIHIEGSGGLKACTNLNDSNKSRKLESQMTLMTIEVHIQCRTGKARVNDSTEIAMRPDSSRDPIFAVCYVHAFDPGSGEKIVILERGCIFVPTENELSSLKKREASGCTDTSKTISSIGKTMGISSQISTEVVSDERKLLLRIASLVQWKDPDALMSWDTQGGGLGYLIDRGLAIGKSVTGGKETDAVKNIDMVRLLGRTPKVPVGKDLEVPINSDNSDDAKPWTGSALGAAWDDKVGAGTGPSSIKGRLVLNGWKIMSEEVKHPNASYLPSMVSTVLKKRIPFHDDLILTRWYGGGKGVHRWRVLKYRITQAVATILLFDALDVIGRAGEAARLSGVEFSQSFPGIRGSQYKVEGVLLRALQSLMSDERGEKKGKQKPNDKSTLSSSSAGTMSQSQSPWKINRNVCKEEEIRPEERNYFFYSPSKNDCSNQEALECQAMTLEPKSGFHFDPVVVCDFTALYPSLVIAYNLCYSTCAGKLEYHSTREEMRIKGRTTSKLGPFDYDEIKTAFVLKNHMKSLAGENNRNDRAYCTPTGSIFVAEDVLKGVLPNVLDEMLSTRAMLKKAAKAYKKNLPEAPTAVLRQLEARQLALKYVANVTYGYTSATFSGRSAMPLLADAIVECGRRTLSNAIALANKWGADDKNMWFGADVVYGDTDSVFIKLPGRTVKEAFEFGKEFCDAVTESNPPPVQLKLEKVYSATLLQTKKKYCGMKFESPEQKAPIFEAKGIETIRKDQCALTQKILRNALITAFRDRGLSNVKDYLSRQWALIHAGRLPVSDFILTGRVRSQYRGKVGPVQAALARRLAEADPGRTVQHKERLAYIIVASPGRSFKLRDCVLTPNELLAQWDSYTLHAVYYATKHVNASLNRCFGLPPFRINVNTWYESCPKPQKRIHHWPLTHNGGSSMISAYFGSDQCAICNRKCKTDDSSKAVICSFCKVDKVSAAYLAMHTLNSIQQKANKLASMCQNCNGCFESSGTYAPCEGKKVNATMFGPKIISGGILSPIANCTCIDCPITYKRHEMREAEIEALSLCKVIQAFGK